MEDQTTSIDQPNQKQQAGETGTEDEGTKKRYKTRTFGVRVLEAELMTAGITNHSEPLTPHGFGGEYVTSFEQFIQDLKDTNKDQERIKAQQKEKTAELNGKLKELTRRMRFARDTVKSVIPQELWKEFGITATR